MDLIRQLNEVASPLTSERRAAIQEAMDVLRLSEHQDLRIVGQMLYDLLGAENYWRKKAGEGN